MVFKGEAYQENDSGNWNNAQRYSSDKIIVILVRLDELEKIAKTGYSDFFKKVVTELNLNYKENIDSYRLEAFKDLVTDLVLLCSNSKFAIEKQKDDFTKLFDHLKKIEKMIQTPKLLYIRVHNQITKTQKIRLTPQFEQLLNIVSEIKCALNSPLNANNLIFNPKEKRDIKEIKKAYMDNLINRG